MYAHRPFVWTQPGTKLSSTHAGEKLWTKLHDVLQVHEDNMCKYDNKVTHGLIRSIKIDQAHDDSRVRDESYRENWSVPAF